MVLEPIARNTAPAIAAATLIAAKNGPRLVHVLASDTISASMTPMSRRSTPPQRRRAPGASPHSASRRRSPATGFGYIEAGAKEASGAHVVQRFVEKPNEERAKEMLATGNYYWNSGMFLFSSDVFLSECAAFAPDVLAAAKASVDNARVDLDFVRLGEAEFAQSPDISVDYAIFEHTKLASVAPSPIQWSDLGAWDAVWKESECDAEGNVARGPVNLYNTKNSFVFSESAHVAVNGVEDAVVLVSEDAVYVGKLTDAQDVGKVVKDLMKNRRPPS